MTSKNAAKSTEITPDHPVMRSVALQRPEAGVLRVHSSPVTSKSYVTGGDLAADEKSRHKVAAAWHVSEARPLPDLHLLERTHVFVDAPVSLVASRVAECLRSNSIAANFHVGESMLEAETNEHVQFLVYLWHYENQVVVEAQRMSGCSYGYSRTAKAVLRAAKGMEAAQRKIPMFAIPSCVPRISMEESKSHIESALEIASDLLKKDRMDAHLLAMESLGHLTRSNVNAEFTAHCVLENAELLSTLLGLIQSFRVTRTAAESLSSMELEHLVMMHRYALTILANCVAALQTSGKLVHVLVQQPELTDVNLISSLLHEVKRANLRPHDACEAMKCLQCLVLCSSSAKESLLQLSASHIVLSAHALGSCSHAVLHAEADKLSELLG